MKKLLITILLTLLFPLVVSAASLSWDYVEDDRSRTDGFVVYFSDGTNNYQKPFLKEETVIDGQRVLYQDIDNNLNLHSGIEYSFTLTRYNSTTESEHSNEVTYLRPTYLPPEENLPDPVSYPQSPGGITIE